MATVGTMVIANYNYFDILWQNSFAPTEFGSVIFLGHFVFDLNTNGTITVIEVFQDARENIHVLWSPCAS
jgi:hypothetical protein